MPFDSHNGATRPIGRTSYELARELQATKMREIRDALITAGYLHLDAQARALGLSRSTAWSILQANHKRTAITAAVIKRMLDQPGLPSSVRAKILEHVETKPLKNIGKYPSALRPTMPRGRRRDAKRDPRRWDTQSAANFL